MTFPIRVTVRSVIIEQNALLCVEYEDNSGLHYNLPGGGVEAGESLHEAVQRETHEEANVRVEPGELLFIIEYEPVRNRNWAEAGHTLCLIFAARMLPGQTPSLSAQPDDYQTGVRWIPLSELESVELLPHIDRFILQYALGEGVFPMLLEEPIQPARAWRYLQS